MKKTLVTAAITVLLIQVLAFFVGFGPGRFDMAGFGLINGLFAVLAFIVGIISVAISKTDDVGKGILIASGVLLLIGVSVCSNSNGFG